MLLDLSVRTFWQDDTAVVTCRGRIHHGVTSCRLRAAAGCLILRHRRVVLDLRGITHVDACGVGTLAALVRLARWSGGRLIISSASARVNRVLELAGLAALVEDDDDVGPPDTVLPSTLYPPRQSRSLRAAGMLIRL